MKRAGLFILESGPFLRECEWLRRRMAQSVPGLHPPAAVAVGMLPLLLEALSARIKQCDLFVVAAEPRQYYSLKAQLLEALGLPVQVDQGVAALQRKYPEDTVFPAGSVVFTAPDARYNGFAMRCGRQHMLVLPLRMDLLESMEAKLTQYLRGAACVRVIPIAPAAETVDDVFARLSAYECMEPLTPESIVPMQPVPAPARAVREFGPQPQAMPRRRARRIFAGGIAALVAAAGMFVGANRMSAIEERQVSRAQYRAGDAVRLDSALLNTAAPTVAAAPAAAAAPEESPPAVMSALLQQAAAAAQEQAGVQADEPFSLDPLDPAYEVNFGRMLLDFIEWLLDLMRAVQDKVAPPTENSATAAPASPTDSTTTTAAPTTTTTTTATTTTTTTTTTTAAQAASKGVYSFSAAGYGHGVGLSQEGAKVLANQGKNYEEIIRHYYPGVAISTDAGHPSAVTHGGASYELKEYLARVAYAEIGRCGLVPDEAIRAQMICAYTISKRNSFRTTDTNQVLLSSSDWTLNFTRQFHEKMLSLAGSVLGKYVTYNGQTAETLYYASCAGYTASAQYAWSGNAPLPYLAGGVPSPETVARSYPAFTTDQVKGLVTAYNARFPAKAITLGADASQWLKILRTDAHGYVEQFQIGDRVLTGGEARLYFFGATALRSHNFTMSFQAN
ncbi:MAG: hypothetical protein LBB75_02790 [Oscillospiraceae bacterium]|jgi:peptidoglycan hydrolase-like amidase|nr:hypothetical protein [Oscillospiraceae bacterium]